MSNLVKFDPFSELQALQKQIFGDDAFTPTIGTQIPTADVYTKDDKELVVEAHLPNFEDSDVSVQVLDNDLLEIQAERHEKEEDKSKKYVIRESSSSFYRRIRLPRAADANKVEAHMKDGLLTVKVPLKESPKPKKIAIKKK